MSPHIWLELNWIIFSCLSYIWFRVSTLIIFIFFLVCHKLDRILFYQHLDFVLFDANFKASFILIHQFKYWPFTTLGLQPKFKSKFFYFFLFVAPFFTDSFNTFKCAVTIKDNTALRWNFFTPNIYYFLI